MSLLTTNITAMAEAQVFGIRVDQAVQELRDFIVDSQLMQDFDEPAVAITWRRRPTARSSSSSMITAVFARREAMMCGRRS